GGLVLSGCRWTRRGGPGGQGAAHLSSVKPPMLFVQGSRDPFGTPAELQPILGQLGALAELFVVEGGDHSFKVPKRADATQQDVFRAIQDRIDTWLRVTITAED